MLDKVKTALRISTDRFDAEITMLMEACKRELRIAGVGTVDETDPLTASAIILYCKSQFGYDNPDSEKFAKSYESIKLLLTLAGGYYG